MPDDVTDWCIARTQAGQTLGLAKGLGEAGYRAWTPSEVIVRRARRSIRPRARAHARDVTHARAESARYGTGGTYGVRARGPVGVAHGRSPAPSTRRGSVDGSRAARATPR